MAGNDRRGGAGRVQPWRPPARRRAVLDLGAAARSSMRSAPSIEVLFDGGIRSGQDIMRAVALGARACLSGRAYVYGLGAGWRGRRRPRHRDHEERAQRHHGADRRHQHRQDRPQRHRGDVSSSRAFTRNPDFASEIRGRQASCSSKFRHPEVLGAKREPRRTTARAVPFEARASRRHLSDCVLCQAGCHCLRSLIMALRITRVLRATAMRATILGLPIESKR